VSVPNTTTVQVIVTNANVDTPILAADPTRRRIQVQNVTAAQIFISNVAMAALNLGFLLLPSAPTPIWSYDDFPGLVTGPLHAFSTLAESLFVMTSNIAE